MHPENRKEIDKVRAYIAEAEAVVNKLQIIPRVLKIFPFDSIAFGLINKTFALSKACLTLLDSGFPDEAYGLSRSLVECAITLRYLTQDPDQRHERTLDFINYFLTYKQYWLHQGLERFVGKPEEDAIREYAKEIGLTPDPKSAFRHWSGKNSFIWTASTSDHPLDGPAITLEYRKSACAVNYVQASSFVHCTQPALDNYFPEQQTPFFVAPSSGSYDQPSQEVLFIITIYLHSSIAYALFGFNWDRPEGLNKSFENARNGLKPVQRLHH
jgi:hypothetical protein